MRLKFWGLHFTLVMSFLKFSMPNTPSIITFT